MLVNKYFCDICEKEITPDKMMANSDPVGIFIQNIPLISLDKNQYDICMDCYQAHIVPLFKKEKK